ncbi:N-acetylneuraminic acid mutarotase [Sphingobacterium allocomposti]|uniref:N-acetylneuraminic acid mutarotase n=1 Tax=Sphingobacterium allocomposti TaxID=415956 RepID=A0A5S5DQ13_9SPHI|nr:N-acetylneuraminic acid mutarotase [Sphingobacterium composti Yoo et al. 2007 non Ten et al. 2007]
MTYQDKIYVIGAFTGEFPHEIPVPNIYIYDPANDTWTEGAEIPESRRRGAAGVVVHNGKFYLAGGAKDGHWGDNSNNFDEYDPETGKWTVLPDMPRVRDHFQAVVVNNKFYATAGRKSLIKENKGFELTYGEVDVFDFNSGKWTTLPKEFDLPTQRAGNATINYGNGFIVVGGESSKQIKAHNEVEYFDPEKGWKLLNRLTKGRHGTQVVRINNTYYVAAGCAHRGGSPELNDIEVISLDDKN